MADRDVGNLHRGRDQEVHERRGERLPALVVDDALVERAADALRDAAADLALDDHRVHERAAVVVDDVPEEREVPGLDVDLDDRRVAPAREGRVGRRVVPVRLEPRRLALLEHRPLARFHEPQRSLGRLLAVRVADRVRDRRQRAERQLLAGRAPDPRAAVGQLEVIGRDFEQARGQAQRLVAHLQRGAMDRVAARDQAAAGVGAGAPVELGRVAGDDRDVRRIAAERVGGDLGERRAVPLPLRRQARRHQHLAARFDTDVRALVGTDAGALDVAAESEPEVATGAARLGLAATELAGPDHLERHRQTGRVVAAVVAGGAAVLEREPHVPRKLVGLDEVAPPHLRGLEPELARDQRDHALHHENAVRAAGAAIRGHDGFVRVGDFEFDRVILQPIWPR